jgi:membrane associated rhomboid family serine protease
VQLLSGKMLEDRSYMREPEFKTRTVSSMTITLLLVHLAAFVLLEINRAYNREGFLKIFQYCALSTEGLSRGHLWQFLTFQFLHAGGWHFAFNMLGLYLFGRAVEESVGRRHFLLLYFASGVVGGVLQSILGFLFPNAFGLAVVGASAGVFGVIAAFAALDPDREILLFFVLPMRAKHFLWIAAGVALFYIVVPAEPGVAHGAHLGGMLAGVAYVRWIIQSAVSLRMWQPFRPRRRPQELVKVRFPKAAPWQKAQKGERREVAAGDFISREVDPILDKISAHGIQSLTERERKILEAAREKMERR